MTTKPKAIYQKFVSPAGVARYPKITTPDTKGQYATGRYKTDVVFDEVGLASMKKALTEFAAKNLPGVSNPHLPIKVSKDGVTFIVFKGGMTKDGEARKPALTDAKKNAIPKGVEIGAGSKIKVAGTMATYEKGPNKGVTIYLDAVQVIDLVEGSEDPTSRFAEEDGYVAEASEAADEAGSEFSDSSDALKL